MLTMSKCGLFLCQNTVKSTYYDYPDDDDPLEVSLHIETTRSTDDVAMSDDIEQDATSDDIEQDATTDDYNDVYYDDFKEEETTSKLSDETPTTVLYTEELTNGERISSFENTTDEQASGNETLVDDEKANSVFFKHRILFITVGISMLLILTITVLIILYFHTTAKYRYYRKGQQDPTLK
ncbi:unnamed protein product [Didymodactylos carnosus]|uniref:Uncharacterized protein n=1 Tax=Didymodactylos carnosus TaxID=1234261 RepID=A0A813U709_9BILA|nr:unnamed protein product [Didymodactylos carnosus]CAF0823584.1 unnamed protein product [Didymodactylos carnosus]CAF3583523.1 unnamed protein product [Didymodactylos carnosus]CAF3610209.1 unnamed protein product [Didymodactylos carnosus]